MSVEILAAIAYAARGVEACQWKPELLEAELLSFVQAFFSFFVGAMIELVVCLAIVVRVGFVIPSMKPD